MTHKKLTKEKIKMLIEEATMDCYSDYECINGFACSLEDNLKFPFKARVVGEDIEVIGVEMSGDEVIAVCERKGEKHSVNVMDLEVDPDKVKGFEWIEAYRAWR